MAASQRLSARMPLPVVNAIWIGPKLGQIHCACLRSFSRQGHRVVLHCYERPKDTPAEVEIADASKLLPESRIIRHRGTGSPALFSDLLRYEILGAGLGLYVDVDVFCLNPVDDCDYILGWEGIQISSAVLKLPPDCPVLDALRAIKDAPNFVPPWNPPKRRWIGLRGPALPKLEDQPWGTIGPHALTNYAKQFGVDRMASPTDRFFPLHWDHVGQLYRSKR